MPWSTSCSKGRALDSRPRPVLRAGRESQPSARVGLWKLRYGVLDRLHGASLDHLAGRLGLEYRRLLGERVDALALLGGRLLDHDHAHEPGHDEDAIFLQLGMADGGHGLKDALDVLAGEFVLRLVGEKLDQFRLGKRTFSHRISFGLGWVWPMRGSIVTHRLGGRYRRRCRTESRLLALEPGNDDVVVTRRPHQAAQMIFR